MFKFISGFLILCVAAPVLAAPKKQIQPVATYIQSAQTHFTTSRKERAEVTDEPQTTDAVKVMPKGEVGSVYYRSVYVSFEPEEFKKAIEALDEGIAAYPDYLDMRLAKVALCGQNEESGCLVSSIKEVMARSKKNRQNWLLSNGSPVPDSQSFLLNAVSVYQEELFKKERYEDVQEVSEAILKVYKNYVPAMVRLAEKYMVADEDYKKAKKLLTKADKLAPNSPVIMADLAEVYSQLGDTARAVVYQQRAAHGRGANAASQKLIDDLLWQPS